MTGVKGRLAGGWRWLVHLGWTVVLTVHIVGAAAWWWFTPRGFPISHPKFWFNSVLPPVILMAAIIARLGPRRIKSIASLRIAILGATPVLWGIASIASLILFPDTFGWAWMLPFLLATLLGFMWLTERHREQAEVGRIGWIVLPIAYFIGAGFPTSEHAPDPDTRPLLRSPQTAPRSFSKAQNTHLINANASVNAAAGTVTVTHGNIVLGIEPILAFHDQSPDGCWTLFSPQRSMGPRRFIGSVASVGLAQQFFYGDQYGNSFMQTEPGASGGIVIQAQTAVNSRAWSHLNTFTEMSVAGHKRLSIEFSPCAGKRIEILPMDYPFGRPARFAYLDDERMFHVVQASSAEKGPFHDLASGALMRGQPLTMTLYDEQAPVLSVTMDDWTSQCSTQLSPTAGWGVPVNSIEFSLSGEALSSAASIFVTLAATSVGRGFDTVGHTPGTYRNRIVIKRIVAPATTPSGIP